MNKSLFIFLAIIAAASALRLPVDIKAAIAKIELARQKDGGYALADAVPEQPYENEAMADVVPEIPYETEGMGEDAPRQPPVQAILEKLGGALQKEEEYEHENMADEVPEIRYESEGMADPVPEVAYESEGMADTPQDAPRPPVALRTIFGKVHSLHQREKADDIPEIRYESKGMIDVAQPYETEGMGEDAAPQPLAQVILEKLGSVVQKKEEYEHEGMADAVPELPYESEGMADPVAEVAYESEGMADIAQPYETEGMSEDDPRPPFVLRSIIERIGSPRQQNEEEHQAYESEHMADSVYESKGMADEPNETVDIKDEATSDESEDDINDEKEIAEEEVYAIPEPIESMADGGDSAFGRRFAADSVRFEWRPLSADEANDVIAFADGLVAAIQKLAADNGIELNRKLQPEGEF